MKAKKIIALVALSGSMLVSSAAMAGDPLLGAIVGGSFGAVIGHSVGGHDGAVVGGLLGAVVGADSANRRYYDYGPSYSYGASYGPSYDYGPSYGYGAVYGPTVVYSPPPRIYRRAPRVVYEGYRHNDRYEARRGYVRYERHERRVDRRDDRRDDRRHERRDGRR